MHDPTRCGQCRAVETGFDRRNYGGRRTAVGPGQGAAGVDIAPGGELGAPDQYAEWGNAPNLHRGNIAFSLQTFPPSMLPDNAGQVEIASHTGVYTRAGVKLDRAFPTQGKRECSAHA